MAIVIVEPGCGHGARVRVIVRVEPGCGRDVRVIVRVEPGCTNEVVWRDMADDNEHGSSVQYCVRIYSIPYHTFFLWFCYLECTSFPTSRVL